MMLTGTDAFRALCVTDSTEGHPTIWDRPGVGGNLTDFWENPDWRGGEDFGRFDVGRNDTVWGGTGIGMSPPAPGQMDVNECLSFPGLCRHGKCRNTKTGFTCDCDPGYEMVSMIFFA